MNTKLNIALVQTALVWENPALNRKNLSRKIDAVAQGTDIIILPEMFTTGFTMTPRNMDVDDGLVTLQWMRDKAKQKQAAIIGSIPFYKKGKYTNRLFFVHPDASHQHYDKRHTFTLAGEGKVYQAGSQKSIVDYKGFKICPMICYDLRFPVWTRNTEDYDVLLFVANWPKPRIVAWDALLKARAIENMAYCIGVNRVGKDRSGNEYPGHSAVYDVLGKALVFSIKEETLYTVINKGHITSTREKLMFLEDRDGFTLAP